MSPDVEMRDMALQKALYTAQAGDSHEEILTRARAYAAFLSDMEKTDGE